jgi:ParB-like chromosome segregation protein Spo0J
MKRLSRCGFSGLRAHLWEAVTDNIKAFGFTVPILIDEDGVILAGHGRLAAAKLLGLAEVPAIELLGLSEPQKRALLIADNRTAEKAGWTGRSWP